MTDPNPIQDRGGPAIAGPLQTVAAVEPGKQEARSEPGRKTERAAVDEPGGSEAMHVEARAEMALSGDSLTADLEPLLHEEAKAKIAQDLLDPSDTLPLKLWLNFPRALVAGYGSIVEAKLENSGEHSLEHLSVILESSSLNESVEVTARHLPPGYCTQQRAEVNPVKAGNFVLRCNVKSLRTDQAYAFRGTIPITVNIAPESSNFVVNFGDIQCMRGDGANRGLGTEFAPVNISNLIPTGAIRTLNDLLNVKLPESYGKVLLELDYEVSQNAIEQHTGRDNAAWTIPKQFLAHAQSGTKLKLDPGGKARQSDGSGKLAAIHLVARNVFRIGRGREQADFLAWFWPDPHSKENAEKTKSISRAHAVAEVQDEKLILRDISTYGSTFEGHALTKDRNEPFDQRGTLILGHEYHVDVSPFPSTILGGLRISNVRAWCGPVEKEKPPAHGAVRFMPVNSEIALLNAVWIFTDANFGCSRVNPIVLDTTGAVEVEGRFSYFRKNFWVETLPTGSGVLVGGYKLKPLELVPIVNGAEIVIAGVTYRATVEA